MSRSGCTDGWDYDQWNYIRWRGAVNSAIKGKRGQLFLKDLIRALDDMPVKELISNDIITIDPLTQQTNSCALGALLLKKGTGFINPDDPEHHEDIAYRLNISPTLVREVEYLNDDAFGWGSGWDSRAARWKSMRDWAESQLQKDTVTD